MKIGLVGFLIIFVIPIEIPTMAKPNENVIANNSTNEVGDRSNKLLLKQNNGK